MAWILIRASARDCGGAAKALRSPAGRRPAAAKGRPRLASAKSIPKSDSEPAGAIQGVEPATELHPSSAKTTETPILPKKSEPPEPAPETQPKFAAATSESSKAESEPTPTIPASSEPEPKIAPQPTSTPTPAEAASEPAGDQAWIMHGDLAHALFQAGALSVMARELPAPRSVFAGGFSAINAILLCAGGGRAITRGWERLRSSRLIFDYGLQEFPVVAALLGAHMNLEQVLSGAIDFKAVCASPIQLHLSAGNVYLSTDSIESPEHVRALTVAAIQEGACGDTVWGKAIDEAAGHGSSSGVLVGIPERIVEAATEPFRVGRINYETDEKPRILDFVLPGCGAIDRLIGDGRRAGERWLKSHRFSAPA